MSIPEDFPKILGKAIRGLRDKLLISTKATFNLNPATRNAMGSSRFHLIEACEASLKRLNTDHIDIYHMHGFDANTPVEETLRALDDLITAGKDPLYRLLQLLRLAFDEVAFCFRTSRMEPLRSSAGLLFTSEP